MARHRRRARPTRRPGLLAPPRAPRPLTPALEAFAKHYDANGNNGTRAWLSSHPRTKSIKAAATSAWEALNKPEIARRVDALAQVRYQKVAMSGEEAAALVAGDAKADPRDLFDEHDKMLPVHQWPDSVARSIRSVRALPDGGFAVTLNDSLAARKLILEQTGKLKSPLAPITDLAQLLADKYREGE
jgi:hypothetical protein